jgi:CRP/FNR family transcriptional regulator
MLSKRVAQLPVSPADRERFDALADELRFQNNEVIFTEREHARYVYFLSGGVVRRHTALRDGRRHIVGYAVPGDFLVAPQSSRKAFVADAIGEVAVKRFPRSRFLELAEISPRLLMSILRFTALETQLAHHKLVLLGRATPEERLLAFLLMWQQKLAPGEAVSSEIVLPMKRHDIADYLGLTFETVSRIFTKLQREQLIAVRRAHVRFIDRERAAALAGITIPQRPRYDDAVD